MLARARLLPSPEPPTDGLAADGEGAPASTRRRSLVLELDPILSGLLNLQEGSEVELHLQGGRLVVVPVGEPRSQAIADAIRRVGEKYDETFALLAK